MFSGMVIVAIVISFTMVNAIAIYGDANNSTRLTRGYGGGSCFVYLPSQITARAYGYCTQSKNNNYCKPWRKLPEGAVVPVRPVCKFDMDNNCSFLYNGLSKVYGKCHQMGRDIGCKIGRRVYADGVKYKIDTSDCPTDYQLYD